MFFLEAEEVSKKKWKKSVASFSLLKELLAHKLEIKKLWRCQAVESLGVFTLGKDKIMCLISLLCSITSFQVISHEDNINKNFLTSREKHPHLVV